MTFRPIAILGIASLLFLTVGCQEQLSKTAESPSTGDSSTPPSTTNTQSTEASKTEPAETGSMPEANDQAAPAVATSDNADQPTLTGLSYQVPDNWVPVKAEKDARIVGDYGKLEFQLIRDGQPEPNLTVAVTHFPGMKGKDDMNIARWVGQFKQADGRPTQDVAKTDKWSQGEINITMVDISGIMAASSMSMGPKDETPNSRQIAAIIDHPQGPHFFRMTGPAETVARWEDSAKSFLKGCTTK